MVKDFYDPAKASQSEITTVIEPWPPFALAVVYSWKATGLTIAEAREFLLNRPGHSKDSVQNLKCSEFKITWGFGKARDLHSYLVEIAQLDRHDEIRVSVSIFPQCSTHLESLLILKELCAPNEIHVSDIEVCLDGDGVWGHIRNVDQTILDKILAGSKVTAAKAVTDANSGWSSSTKEFSIIPADDVLLIK